MSIGLVIDVLVKAMVIGLSLYPVVRPDSSHFAGKAMGVRAVLYPATTLVIPFVWLAAGRPGPYPFVADLVMSLAGSAAAALVMATLLWPPPGTPATVFGWT